LYSILFGLSSALTWGAADFYGALASRKARAFLAVLFGEAFGLAFLLIAALIVHESGIGLTSWLMCSAAGCLGVLGLLLFFYSFTKKQIAFVAPISALVSTFLPIIIGALREGFPAWWTFAGFCLAMLAIWLISRPAGASSSLRLRLVDLALPILAGICFGLYFVLFHEGSQQGFVLPLVATRSAGVLTILVVTLAARQSLLPPAGAWHYFILNGVLDVAGNAFYLLAGQVGRMDTAAVIASLYPAVTILLAWLLLREKISRPQLGGILIALAAIVLMTIPG
jgi:drug/metabolite transporter (DMT)-like permease